MLTNRGVIDAAGNGDLEMGRVGPKSTPALFDEDGGMPSCLQGQRVQEFVVATLCLIVGLCFSLLPVVKSKVPDMQINVNGLSHSFYGMEISYPVKLDGQWCSAAQIENTADSCGAGDKTAFQQIPNWLLVVIGPFFSACALVFLDSQLEKRRDTDDDARSSTTFPYGGKVRAGRDGVLGLMISMALTGLLTNSLKQIVGRPRPNMLALIALDSARYAKEAWKSFPSGHSSFAACTLHYLSLWLARTYCGHQPALHSATSATVPPAGGTARHCAISYMVYLPTVLSLWVATTRVQDYWHHYSDAIAGCLIGYAAAHCAFTYVCRHSKSEDYTKVGDGRQAGDVVPTK